MYKFLSLILILTFSSASYAQTLKGEHKAWSVFTVKQSGEKICYITSSPIKKTGNYKRRGEPYLLVTYRGKGISEVSSSSGYPYKKNSKVDLSLNKKASFKLFTSSDTPKMAWAKDVSEDKRIISSMKKGSKLTIKGFSKLGTYSLDTYSLMGFTKAYNKMTSLCR